jgi:hypothetical protein
MVFHLVVALDILRLQEIYKLGQIHCNIRLVYEAILVIEDVAWVPGGYSFGKGEPGLVDPHC